MNNMTDGDTTNGEQTDPTPSNNPARRRRRKIIIVSAASAVVLALILGLLVPALVRGGDHHDHGRPGVAYMLEGDWAAAQGRQVEDWEARLGETLAPLVDGGTLSESQSDAVIETLLEARGTTPGPYMYRPAMVPPGYGRHGHR